MKTDQLKRLKENQRLRLAVSDLTLDKLILAEAARGNRSAPLAAASALIVSVRFSAYRNAAPVGHCGSTTPPIDASHPTVMMRPV